MYEMKDAYKTNIDIVDEQHKHLFEITDKTYELLTNDLLVDKDDYNLNTIDDNQDASIRDLLEFLNFWLVNHIINMDKKIGEA